MATYATRLTFLGRALSLVCCGWLLTAPVPCAAQPDPATVNNEEHPIDLVMFHDPQLDVRKIKVTLPRGLKELWLKAMGRPDSELRRLAADSFALAHERGLQGLAETHGPLADLLKSPDPDLVVQRAAARGLIKLDARDRAPVLADVARSQGLAMSLLVEPALGRWKSDAMKDAWLARIDNPRASRAARILAINGLGEIAETSAAESLKRIATDPTLTANERVAAAQSLSTMRAPDLVDLAQGLAETESQPALLNQVLAINVLQREESPEAIALLSVLGSHPSTAIQAGALQRLYAIDPMHVYGFAEEAIKSNDATVRSLGAEALIVQKQVKWIAPLASLLDDVNPTLRRRVAKAMVQLAGEPELHAEVIKQATVVLNRTAWRGIEQAAVVLVLLDHKPAGDRFAELLQNPRGEVKIATAWGLRRLALPEHLPAMLAQAKHTHQGFLEGKQSFEVPGSGLQLAQLFMAFGEMRYMEPEPILMHYVPKDLSLDVFVRSAAVWSVGLLNEGKAPVELTETLIGRLTDTMSPEPELDYVRRMSAISIGRMKSTFATERVRTQAATDSGYPLSACYWALEQLTGEPPPVLEEAPLNFSDWFLVPTR